MDLVDEERIAAAKSQDPHTDEKADSPEMVEMAKNV